MDSHWTFQHSKESFGQFYITQKEGGFITSRGHAYPVSYKIGLRAKPWMSILALISSALFGRNSQCSFSSPCHSPSSCKSATLKEAFSGQKCILGLSTNDKPDRDNSVMCPTFPPRGFQQDWAPVAHTCNLHFNANMLVSLLFLSNCSFWSHPSNKLLALKPCLKVCFWRTEN